MQPSGLSVQPPATPGMRTFPDAMKQLLDDGWEICMEGQPAPPQGSAPNDVVEVVLECVWSSCAEVASLPLKHKCLALQAGKGPWSIGRLHQPQFFNRLVPDEALCTCISRNHIEVSQAEQALNVKKLSANFMLIDGAVAPNQQPCRVGHGARISFIGKDNQKPFLMLSILLRNAAASAQSAGQPCQAMTPGSPAHQSASTPQGGSNSGFVLQCVQAHGVDVNIFPPEARNIIVPADSSSKIGRSHQIGFFENLLQKAPQCLTFISRTHLELVPNAADPGAIKIGNLGSNPFYLGQRQLKKGDTDIIRPPQTLNFVMANQGDTKTAMSFLRMSLHLGCSHEEPKGAPSDISPSGKNASNPCNPTSARGPTPTPAPAISPQQVFSLALGGTAVKADAPATHRRLEAVGNILTVGRAHQNNLFTELLVADVSTFISREHFRITRVTNGECHLIALGTNPFWHQRDGVLKEIAKGDDSIVLAGGDMILLFTGAADCTPDGPDSLGTLHWTFCDPSQPVRESASLDNEVLGDATKMVKPSDPRKKAIENHTPEPTPHQQLSRNEERFLPSAPSAPERHDDKPSHLAPVRQMVGDGPAPKVAVKRKAKSSRAPAAGSLQIPFAADFLAQEDQDADLSPGKHMDISIRDANDKFAASGFSFGK